MFMRLCALAGAPLLLTATSLAGFDYSRLPDDPRVVSRQLADAKTGLAAAIKIAEEATKARAAVAEMVLRDGQMRAVVRLMG